MNLAKKVSVTRLEIGMYVAQLDRPWLETPFLFQGFYIRDDDEISETGKHCEHVFVIAENVPEAPQAPTGSRPAKVTIEEVPEPDKKRFSFRSPENWLAAGFIGS